MAATSSDAAPAPSPLFRFGLIADIQYVDDEDATNFVGSKVRRYRQSLQCLRNAVQSWNQVHHDESPLAFVLQLGDALDGKCASVGQSVSAAEDLQECMKACLCDQWHFCIGNHEMYNFSREEWIARMFLPQHTNSYYDFSPHDGWRVVVLDSYEVSLMKPKDSPEYEEALAVLTANNPNDVLNGNDWFAGVEGLGRRFVPYNGQFSQTQLEWFQGVLQRASDADERVLIACHQPVFKPCTNFSNLPWNYETVLEMLHSFPGTVVAWIAGHDHDGGYAVDEAGIHHLVPAAPLECAVNEDSFGHMEVLEGDAGLRIRWTGKAPVKGQPPEILACPQVTTQQQLASSL